MRGFLKDIWFCIKDFFVTTPLVLVLYLLPVPFLYFSITAYNIIVSGLGCKVCLFISENSPLSEEEMADTVAYFGNLSFNIFCAFIFGAGIFYVNKVLKQRGYNDNEEEEEEKKFF